MAKLEDSLMKAAHIALLEMWSQFGVSLPNGEDLLFLSFLKSPAYYLEHKVLRTRNVGVSDTEETWRGTL